MQLLVCAALRYLAAMRGYTAAQRLLLSLDTSEEATSDDLLVAVIASNTALRQRTAAREPYMRHWVNHLLTFL
jgi:hypothetical protein